MLLKNYDSVPGRIHYIENISDVVVHMSVYRSHETGPELSRAAPNSPVVFRNTEELDPDKNIKFIDYTDSHGVRTRLSITAFAYLCNDRGQTVEKIIVDNPLNIRL